MPCTVVVHFSRDLQGVTITDGSDTLTGEMYDKDRNLVKNLHFASAQVQQGEEYEFTVDLSKEGTAVLNISRDGTSSTYPLPTGTEIIYPRLSATLREEVDVLNKQVAELVKK